MAGIQPEFRMYPEHTWKDASRRHNATSRAGAVQARLDGEIQCARGMGES